MALLSVSHLAVAASPAGARELAEQLRDQALRDSRAWDILDSLVSEVGARPTGSLAMTRAKGWAVRTFYSANCTTSPAGSKIKLHKRLI